MRITSTQVGMNHSTSRVRVSDSGQTAAVGVGLEADSYRRVLEVILSGQLVPGMIVRERPLAAELGVSRTPLRQALGRLESEGFLVRQNRVVQVRRIDLPTVIEIYQLRILLEVEAIGRATGRIEQTTIARFHSIFSELAVQPAGGQAVSAGMRFDLADDEFHLAIADASGNRTLRNYVADLRRKTQLFGITQMPIRRNPGAAEHLAILGALEREDRTAAQQEMRSHLERTRNNIIDQFHGLRDALSASGAMSGRGQ
jgi:DNA-binding GntR family transcriptional regulator